MTGSHALELDGLLWKPKPDVTAKPEQFIEARRLFLDLHRDARWNPWVLEDQADKLAAAMVIVDQWTRAEPGFQQLTLEQSEAQSARRDEQLRHEQEQADRIRISRIRDHDPQRSEDRLALLELESIVRYREREIAELVSGEAFPAMTPDRRTAQIRELEQAIETDTAQVTKLRASVGDPEVVVDQHGQLPDDRRELSLMYFRIWREQEVRAARVLVANLTDKLAATRPRTNERSSARHELDRARYRLGHLLEIPPLTASDMCSEYPHPTDWHRWSTRGGLVELGPCPAWPRWAARVGMAREMLLATAPAARAPEPMKPQPLAVIPSGLPVDEVIDRLTTARRRWPDAQVRRGSRNRWEIWPPG